MADVTTSVIERLALTLYKDREISAFELSPGRFRIRMVCARRIHAETILDIRTQSGELAREAMSLALEAIAADIDCQLVERELTPVPDPPVRAD